MEYIQIIKFLAGDFFFLYVCVFVLIGCLFVDIDALELSVDQAGLELPLSMSPKCWD